MILALKTDQDPAEIYLLDNAGEIVAQKIWDAGRTLAKDLLGEIEKLIRGGGAGNFDAKKPSANITGLIVFRGPGSFTGLRIGITVANAIAYAQNIPITGANGKNWRQTGFAKLGRTGGDKIVLPKYGAAPHITAPKK